MMATFSATRMNARRHRAVFGILALALTTALAGSAAADPKGKHFRDEDRAAAEGYWRDHDDGDSPRGCPPGLAKKHNGCLPPGQAKKAWTVGQPLPPTVVYEPAPAELTVHLRPPPEGHEYVRVANDILMIAAGSRLVVDALTDLNRR